MPDTVVELWFACQGNSLTQRLDFGREHLFSVLLPSHVRCSKLYQYDLSSAFYVERTLFCFYLEFLGIRASVSTPNSRQRRDFPAWERSAVRPRLQSAVDAGGHDATFCIVVLLLEEDSA